MSCSPIRPEAVRVVLTQPQPRVAGLALALAGAGHQVICLGFQRIDERIGEAGIAAKLAALGQYDWIIPVSPSAIDVLATFLSERLVALTARLALIGPGSLERWQQSFDALSATPLTHGGLRQTPLLPRGGRYDALALLEEPELADLSGRRVAVIQGSERAPAWVDKLLARGARVDLIAAYRVTPITPSSDEALQLSDWLSESLRAQGSGALAPIAIVVSSVAIAHACSAWCKHDLPAEWRSALDRCQWLSIHENVAQALSQAGWRRIRTIRPGEAGLIEALESGS